MMTRLDLTMTTLAIVLLFTASESRAHSPHDNISTVVASPAFETDDTLFCSLNHINYLVLKSTDRGVTWTPACLGIPLQQITRIVISPAFERDRTLFVGTERQVFRSLDGGDSWHDASAGLPASWIESLAISPDFEVDGTLFAGTQTGDIFRTTTAGATWDRCTQGVTDSYITTIVPSPDFGSDRIVFAGCLPGVLRSDDGGLTWALSHAANDIDRVRDLVVAPFFSEKPVLFAGTWGDGVYRSADGGRSWKTSGAGIDDPFVRTLALSPDYVRDGTLVAASKDAGVFLSVDRGRTWESRSTGLDTQTSQTDVHYFEFAFSPGFSHDRLVFLGAFEGLHMTRNDFESWRHLDVYSQRFVRGMAISPHYSTDGTVYAGTYGGGVYRSTDRGSTWKAIDTGISGMFVAAVAVSPRFSADGIVFASGATDLDRSTVCGNYWSPIKINPSDWIYIRSLALSPGFANDGTMLAGNGTKGDFPVYRSTDRGLSFDPVAAPFELPFSLVVSPGFVTDQTAFAGTERGVYRSTDGGLTWHAAMLTAERVFSLDLSPAFPQDGIVVAAMTDERIFLSNDMGQSWHPKAISTAPNVVIEAVRISPDFVADGTIFAGTKSRGIFKSTDGGDTWSYGGLEGELIRWITISPNYATDGTVFLGAFSGVFKSDDGGATWHAVLDIRRYDDLSDFIRFLGTWTRYDDRLATAQGTQWSNTSGDTATIAFVGEGISWIGERIPAGGIATVNLDGKYVTDVDCYAPSVAYRKTLFNVSGLNPGPHFLAIRVTGTGNPVSLGNLVVVDAFEVEL